MNKVAILAFIAGAMVGAGGANVYLRKKYEEIVQEELESIRETANRTAYNKALATVQNDVKTMAGLTGNYEGEMGQVIYDKEDLGGITPVNDGEEYIENNEPYMITDDAYNDEKLTYDKLDLNYYLGDSALVDERDEVVDDFMHLIGADPAVLFAEAAGDGEPVNVIYVRNEQIGADFEVQLNEVSWAETIGYKRGGN